MSRKVVVGVALVLGGALIALGALLSTEYDWGPLLALLGFGSLATAGGMRKRPAPAEAIAKVDEAADERVDAAVVEFNEQLKEAKDEADAYRSGSVGADDAFLRDELGATDWIPPGGSA